MVAWHIASRLPITSENDQTCARREERVMGQALGVDDGAAAAKLRDEMLQRRDQIRRLVDAIYRE